MPDLERPRVQRSFVHVPTEDWPLVKRGMKSEFRIGGKHLLFDKLQPPCPVVAFTAKRNSRPEFRLMVLLGFRRERLGEITDASVAAEGFNSFEEFRRYWMGRYKRKFTPEMIVSVFTLRPWTEADWRDQADYLFNRLYGGFPA